MELSKKLKSEITRGFNSSASVDVYYPDGEFVSGFIENLSYSPQIDVRLCKHKVPRGEDIFHFLDFNRAIKIEFVYDTETITYE